MQDVTIKLQKSDMEVHEFVKFVDDFRMRNGLKITDLPLIAGVTENQLKNLYYKGKGDIHMYKIVQRLKSWDQKNGLEAGSSQSGESIEQKLEEVIATIGELQKDILNLYRKLLDN